MCFTPGSVRRSVAISCIAQHEYSAVASNDWCRTLERCECVIFATEILVEPRQPAVRFLVSAWHVRVVVLTSLPATYCKKEHPTRTEMNWSVPPSITTYQCYWHPGNFITSSCLQVKKPLLPMVCPCSWHSVTSSARPSSRIQVWTKFRSSPVGLSF